MTGVPGGGRRMRAPSGAMAELNLIGGGMRQLRIERPERFSITESVIFEGDALTVLRRIPDSSVQAAITSPPYWGLRDYRIPDQLGLEGSMHQYINSLRAIFTETRRAFKNDGVFWLNIGDGYTSGNRGWRAPDKKNPARAMSVRPNTPDGLKPKRFARNTLAPCICPPGRRLVPTSRHCLEQTKRNAGERERQTISFT